MLNEIKPGAPGYGARRFVVRNGLAIPESVEAQLRGRIDGLPELYSLTPAFPQPGRRSGSRPAAQPGGAGPGGEAAAPGTEAGGGVVGAPPPDIYPGGRPREGGADLNVTGNLPPPGSPGASAVNTCVGEGGLHMQVSRSVPLGTTVVDVSRAINRPFAVRFVSDFWDVNDPANISTRIKLATDNDTTGGINTTGVSLDTDGFGGAEFGAMGVVQNSYPNLRWSLLPCFIKIIQTNNGAAAHSHQTVINIEFLD